MSSHRSRQNRIRSKVILTGSSVTLALISQVIAQESPAPSARTTPAQSATSTNKPSTPSDISATSSTTQSKSSAEQLNEVDVEGTDVSPTAIAAQDLSKIPGGTNLIDQQKVQQGKVATAADILQGQAGVFAQSAGGTDAIKLSIRGSGVNRGTGYFRTGALFTFDGLPVTGPSGTPYELFEPLGLQYTEVERGGDAFDTGSLGLGGAINYVTNTGYTASPFEARFEAGSFDYYKGQLASGLVSGPFDYYVSATGSSRDGYQAHSESATNRYSVNIGYQINPDIETRLYFRYAWTYFRNPGQLTVDQIKQDPSQANAGYVKYDSHRYQPGSEWLGDKTTINLDPDSSVQLGLVYQNAPIAILGGSTANVIPSVWQYGYISPQVVYKRHDDIDGHASDSLLGFYSSTDIYGNVVREIGNNQTIAGVKYTEGQPFTRDDFTGSSDDSLVLSNNTEIAKDLTLTTGITGVFIRRVTNIVYPVNVPYDSQTFDYKAELGLQYNITPGLQVYGNIDRGVEPRNDWEAVLTPQNFGIPGKYQVLNLKHETDWNQEVGVKFKESIFSGSADYYYSEVNNELLSVNNPVTGLTVENNASGTTHQGVEVNLNTILWQDGKSKEDVSKNLQDPKALNNQTVSDAGDGTLSFNQAYTFSNFYYNNDPVFKHNALPGLPVHYYYGELRYDHPSGFYAGFNTKIASSYSIDYANTVYTKSYAIFGTSIGYDSPKKGFSVFLDFNNITNEHYAADVSSPAYNLGGSTSAAGGAVLDPGDGFGVNSGISYKF